MGKEGNMKEKASVLFVDDEIGLCKTMGFILRGKGYEVTTAEGWAGGHR